LKIIESNARLRYASSLRSWVERRKCHDTWATWTLMYSNF
jgi:hypothetical protein